MTFNGPLLLKPQILILYRDPEVPPTMLYRWELIMQMELGLTVGGCLGPSHRGLCSRIFPVVVRNPAGLWLGNGG